VLEFLKFRDHLLSSLQRASVNVEKTLLEFCLYGPTSYFSHADSNLVKVSAFNLLEFINVSSGAWFFSLKTFFQNARKVEITPEYLKTLGNLTDSRDFDIIDVFRKHLMRSEWRETSFAADKMKLRVRSMLVGLLNNAIIMTEELGNQQPYEVTLSRVEALLDLLEVELGTDTSKFLMTDVRLCVISAPLSNQV